MGNRFHSARSSATGTAAQSSADVIDTTVSRSANAKPQLQEEFRMNCVLILRTSFFIAVIASLGLGISIGGCTERARSGNSDPDPMSVVAEASMGGSAAP